VNQIAASLLKKIESNDALIAIIGLGYVGLPLALAFSEKGFKVLGFDVDQCKIDRIEQKRCYIKHLDGQRLEAAVDSGLLSATSDFDRLAEPDAILVCVPTPLTPQREPDMRYVTDTAQKIRATLRQGQLIILESTTYPGTTDELLKDILESQTEPEGRDVGILLSSKASEQAPAFVSFKCGDNFFLAFSPEREDPGNPDYGTTTIPKVVGGVDKESGDLADALYQKAIQRTVRVSSARAAEATKLTENIFRAVNIALVNELKVVYDRMGIDIWEVLDAASTKPFGFMRFNPGPGWGGHCIPLDPFYLSWKAREHGIAPKFIELAGEVNVEMPQYVVEKLQGALNEQGKSVKGAKILILGLAYKKDIDDPRESPAFEIINRLIALGAQVSYHDPHIPEAPKMRSWPQLPALVSTPLDVAQLENVDAVVLVTDHSAVDYDLVAAHAPLVIDTRGVFRGDSPAVVRA